MMDDYHLKWNQFEKNTANSFAKLRNENTFFDVTLVSNDQKQVSAHKLVLSACSNTFRTIFSNNITSSLVLYLDSLDSTDVNLMLDYIYQGEVNVEQDKLDRFVQMATKFKLDGLLATTEGKNLSPAAPKPSIVKMESVEVKDTKGEILDSNTKDSSNNHDFVEEMHKDEADNPKIAEEDIEANNPGITENSEEEIEAVNPGITESLEQDIITVNPGITENSEKDQDDADISDNKINKLIEAYKEITSVIETIEESEVEDIDYENVDINDSLKTEMDIKSEPLIPKIECSNANFETTFQQKVIKEENFWFCTVCEKTMKQRIDIKRHFENHLSGLSFDCSVCAKSYQKSQALTAHMRKNHKAEIRKYNKGLAVNASNLYHATL